MNGPVVDMIIAILEKHLNRTPHMVINHLKRRKLDPNRSIEFGAQNDPTARIAFETYHGFIDKVKSTFRRGLLIDLHGRNKSDGLTQIGYNIKKTDLIHENYEIHRSSISRLAMENRQIDFIAGKYSFGDLMESEYYAAVPSPVQRRPLGNKKSDYIDDLHFFCVHLKIRTIFIWFFFYGFFYFFSKISFLPHLFFSFFFSRFFF